MIFQKRQKKKKKKKIGAGFNGVDRVTGTANRKCSWMALTPLNLKEKSTFN